MLLVKAIKPGDLAESADSSWRVIEMRSKGFPAYFLVPSSREDEISEVVAKLNRLIGFVLAGRPMLVSEYNDTVLHQRRTIAQLDTALDGIDAES